MNRVAAPDDLAGLRGLVKTYIENRVHSGPMPMDVGMEGQKTGGDEDWNDCDHEDCEIGAVSKNVTCHNCGGKGHFARDCPSEASGKDGGKSGGKGDGKGGGKGNGENGDLYQKRGFNSGFGGKCHRCGKIVHKMADCAVKLAVV